MLNFFLKGLVKIATSYVPFLLKMLVYSRLYDYVPRNFFGKTYGLVLSLRLILVVSLFFKKKVNTVPYWMSLKKVIPCSRKGKKVFLKEEKKGHSKKDCTRHRSDEHGLETRRP